MAGLLGQQQEAGRGAKPSRALDEDAPVAAQALEHPRGIALAGLGQDGEDVRPLEADVAQEIVVQFAEGVEVPAVPGRAGKMEDEDKEARHLSLFLILLVLWKYRAK
jgi:hypothetical protein